MRIFAYYIYEFKNKTKKWFQFESLKTLFSPLDEEAAACVWIFAATLIAATNWFLTSEEPICKNHPITGQEHRRD